MKLLNFIEQVDGSLIAFSPLGPSIGNYTIKPYIKNKTVIFKTLNCEFDNIDDAINLCNNTNQEKITSIYNEWILDNGDK